MSTGVTGPHIARWWRVATGRTWGGRWERVGSPVHQQIGHSRKVVFEELSITDCADDTVIETQPLSYSIMLDFGDVMAFGSLLAIMVNNCNESILKLKLLIPF